MTFKEIFVILLFIFTVAVYADVKRDTFPSEDIKKQKEIIDESDVIHSGLASLAWNIAGHTGTASNFAGFSGAGAAAFYPESDYVLVDGTRAFTGVVTIEGVGTGGYTAYDLKVGDTDGSPTYGMIQIGNASIGRTSHTDGIDLDGAVLFRNIAGPVTSEIEFIFVESTATTCRFALPKSGVGNATYNPRSMLIAGPAPADTDFVKVSYWQGQGIFDNLACDTASDGADLGVQNDLEVEGDIFVDSIKESTTDAGATIESVLLKDGNITGTDVDISAGTGDYSSTGTIASGKHTITSSTSPQLNVESGSGVANFLLHPDSDGACTLQSLAGSARLFFESGTSFLIRHSTAANQIAGNPGTGATTVWTIGDSGDVVGAGILTGHTSITVDNINLNGNTITGSGPPGLHITAAAPITIGDGGTTNYVSVNHSTSDMTFVGGAGLIFGSFWGNNIAFVTAGGTGTFSVISDADITVGQTNGTTFQNNQELDIGAFLGMYLVNYSVTAKGTGANKHLVTAIGVDSGAGDVAQNDGRSHAITLGSAELAMGGTAILDLSATDEVSVMITNETDNTNITIEHVSLSIVQVGGT